jgi:hypothetical protein
VGTGTKEDEPSTGHVWAAVFHHVTVRSRLARVLKLMNGLFISIYNFFSDRGKAQLLEQCIRGHDCIRCHMTTMQTGKRVERA